MSSRARAPVRTFVACSVKSVKKRSSLGSSHLSMISGPPRSEASISEALADTEVQATVPALIRGDAVVEAERAERRGDAQAGAVARLGVELALHAVVHRVPGVADVEEQRRADDLREVLAQLD